MELSIEDTPVTDAGLAHIKQLEGLRELRLRGAKVTAQGVQQLQQALPKLRIDGAP